MASGFLEGLKGIYQNVSDYRWEVRFQEIFAFFLILLFLI